MLLVTVEHRPNALCDVLCDVNCACLNAGLLLLLLLLLFFFFMPTGTSFPGA